MNNTQIETIQVSQKLPVKNGGRSSGFDLKSSLMELTDNALDAQNTYVLIELDTENGKTSILNDEKGLDKKGLSKLLSVGNSGEYDPNNIGNYGLGAFYALTLLGENGQVNVQTTSNNQKLVANLDFTSNTPMNYPLQHSIHDENNDNLNITCKTKSLDIFDNVENLVNDLGAHYHDILNTQQFTIFVKTDNNESEVVKPIDMFYRDSPQTIKWDKGGKQTLRIQDLDFDVTFDGYYVSRNTDKNILDKKGKKGFPHDYQGIYLNLNGRILKLGNGWGIEGTNNKWVGGRMEIKLDTSNLTQVQKESVLKYFGITSNKNNPNLQISERSTDKKQLRDIIKEFRSWVDKEYDKFNKEKKQMNEQTTTTKKSIDLSKLSLINTDLKSIKNYVLLEKMFPELVKSISEAQDYVKSFS